MAGGRKGTRLLADSTSSIEGFGTWEQQGKVPYYMVSYNSPYNPPHNKRILDEEEERRNQVLSARGFGTFHDTPAGISATSSFDMMPDAPPPSLDRSESRIAGPRLYACGKNGMRPTSSGPCEPGIVTPHLVHDAVGKAAVGDRHAADLEETGPLSQGGQEGRQALRMLRIHGM